MKRRRLLIEPRFPECLTCQHFRPANTAKACKGCEAGEFFEEELEELDPDEDVTMHSPSWSSSYDD